MTRFAGGEFAWQLELILSSWPLSAQQTQQPQGAVRIVFGSGMRRLAGEGGKGAGDARACEMPAPAAARRAAAAAAGSGAPSAGARVLLERVWPTQERERPQSGIQRRARRVRCGLQPTGACAHTVRIAMVSPRVGCRTDGQRRPRRVRREPHQTRRADMRRITAGVAWATMQRRLGGAELAGRPWG